MCILCQQSGIHSSWIYLEKIKKKLEEVGRAMEGRGKQQIPLWH